MEWTVCHRGLQHFLARINQIQSTAEKKVALMKLKSYSGCKKLYFLSFRCFGKISEDNVVLKRDVCY